MSNNQDHPPPPYEQDGRVTTNEQTTVQATSHTTTPSDHVEQTSIEYIKSRLYEEWTTPDLTPHIIKISPDTTRSTILPLPEKVCLERDMTANDWARFLKFLLPDDRVYRNCETSDGEYTASGLNEKEIRSVVSEWNEAFFDPRGIRILLGFSSMVSAPVRLPPSVPLMSRLSTDFGGPASPYPDGSAMSIHMAASPIPPESNALFVPSLPAGISSPGALQTRHIVPQSLEDDEGASDVFEQCSAEEENEALISPTVLRAVSRESTINSITCAKEPSLFIAVTNNDFDMVKTLLVKGADPEARPLGQESPLQRAVSKNHIEILRLLLQHGADIESHPSGGATALHNAVSQKQPEIVTILLQHGANTEAKPWGFRSALYEAAHQGNIIILNLLLDKGANPDVFPAGEESALCGAVRTGRKNIVDKLLDHGASPDLRPWGHETPLYRAVSRGDGDVVKRLLFCGADVDAMSVGGHSALCEAVKKRDGDMVRILLKAGANVEAKGWGAESALKCACKMGDEVLVDLLRGGSGSGAGVVDVRRKRSGRMSLGDKAMKWARVEKAASHPFEKI